MAQVISLAKRRNKVQDFWLESLHLRSRTARSKADVRFCRSELNLLISFYSEQVAGGRWRDYALDLLPGQAVFSVFRHAHEAPSVMISKRVTPSGKHREFVVFEQDRKVARNSALLPLLQLLRTQPS